MVEVATVWPGAMALLTLVLEAADQLLAQAAPWNWLVKAEEFRKLCMLDAEIDEPAGLAPKALVKALSIALWAAEGVEVEEK